MLAPVSQDLVAGGCGGAFGGATLEPYAQNGQPVAMMHGASCAVLAGCPRCDYLRFEPLPDAAFLERYYAEQYWDDAALRQVAEAEYAYPGYRLQVAEILRAWTTYGGAARRPRVHDVGCGVGTLVHHLRQEGVHATGSDLSRAAIATGHALGNPALFLSPLADYLDARAGEQIDVFLMSHALEHLRDPVATLRALRDRLPRDGVLWLRVPNGLYQLARGRSWYEFSWLQYPNHLHYFTPRSLACCLAGAGLALAEITATRREDEPDKLLGGLLGRPAASLPRRDRLIEALADNLLTQELQAVALHAGNPRLPAGIAALLDTIEPPR